MTLHRSIPALLFVVASSAPCAFSQGLPATAPTMPSPPLPAQQYLPSPAQPAANRAQVRFSPGGLLSVYADNSSLNQILRDISRATGMKITGGVADERVFGSYGPADPSSVLTTLLKGTGSNMLIVLSGSQAPLELVLTPRNGGATPPSPNAGHEHDEDDLPPRGMPHPTRGPDPNDPRPQQAIRPQLPLQQAQPDASAPPVPTPPAPDTTTEQSPNGVPTPQQIYDQLMKRHQQQQQQLQQSVPPTATTPTTKPPQ